VCPEALDELAPEDARAQRSRRDLQRVHRAMRSLSILKYAVSRLRLTAAPTRILELGAGDGTMLLRLARALKPRWVGVELTLLDRHRVVDSKTIEDYRRLGWRVKAVCADALAWARRPAAECYDLCIATLFLHHFVDPDLRVLLRGIAAQSHAFIACEPRRDGVASLASHLVGLLGANAVTREDAIKSVAAGFAVDEIAAAWPQDENTWSVQEFRALPFSHCFIAARQGVRGEHP
jgi:SAM-dependent methyltransferase